MDTCFQSRPLRPFRPLRLAAALAACLLAAACTGADGVNLGGDAGLKANRCAPDNPYARNANGNLISGYQNGTRSDEKQWLASYFEQKYLWYKEIPDVDPNDPKFNTGTHLALMTEYLKALKTPAEVDGLPKDQYTNLLPTAEYNQRFQAGVTLGYGVRWAVLVEEPPRDIRIAFVQPGSNGAQVGLARGDRLLSVTVGGQTVSVDDDTPAGKAVRNQALMPSINGQSASLQVRRADNTLRTVSVTASPTTSQPVLVSKILGGGTSRTGYLMLNEFNAPAEAQLVTAFQQFSSQGVRDLILDLRYNGGGYIYLASELAYMIAGAGPTRSKVFDRLVYSDKRSRDNTSTPFHSVTSGQSGSNIVGNQPLPTLNLSRITVLTTDETCSASESVINGLRGVGITVDLVGSKTCGKPYGYTQQDNCGLSYFPIEFQGVNARGEGDYANGMAVQCEANDDLSQPLGETTEGMLAAALSYRANGSCPAKKSTEGVTRGGYLLKLPMERGIHLRPEDVSP